MNLDQQIQAESELQERKEDFLHKQVNAILAGGTYICSNNKDWDMQTLLEIATDEHEENSEIFVQLITELINGQDMAKAIKDHLYDVCENMMREVLEGEA